jgi:soluble lytic murein transglycosylase-like protein
VSTTEAVHKETTSTEKPKQRLSKCLLLARFVLFTVAVSGTALFGVLAVGQATARVQMAVPNWNDAVPSWQQQVEHFALRISDGYGVRAEVALEFAPWILEAAARQQLTPELVAGLVLTESSFRKRVTSSVGAVGPAQVRPDYWRKFCGSVDLADPEENIYCGAQILAYYIDRCGAEECALSAYNTGPYSKRLGIRQQAAKRYFAKVSHWRDRLVSTAL